MIVAVVVVAAVATVLNRVTQAMQIVRLAVRQLRDLVQATVTHSYWTVMISFVLT